MEKIGIIFRGLKRSWKQALPVQLKSLDNYYLKNINSGKVSVDLIFLHYEDDHIDEFKDFVKNISTNYNVYHNIIPPPHFAIGGYLTLGYCSWRGAQFKQKIEFDNNFLYDRIIETRYDIVFFEDDAWEKMNNFEPKELHVYFNKKFYTDDSQLPVVLNDFNTVSSGFTYDILGYSYIKNIDILDKLKKFPERIDDNFGAGEGWGIQLRKSGLIADNHDCYPPCLIRQEMYEFDLVLYSNNVNSLLNPIKYETPDVTDSVTRNDYMVPKFLVHILGFHISDIKKTTIIVPEITKDMVTFLECAGLTNTIEFVTEHIIDGKIALFNVDSLFKQPLYKMPLRFKPPNNFTMAAKLSLIKLGYNGSIHNMGFSENDPFVSFVTPINRYSPNVNNLTNSGNMFIYAPVDDDPLTIDKIQEYARYYDESTGVITYDELDNEMSMDQDITMWACNSRIILKCSNSTIFDKILHDMSKFKSRLLVANASNNFITIVYSSDIVALLHEILEPYK